MCKAVEDMIERATNRGIQPAQQAAESKVQAAEFKVQAAESKTREIVQNMITKGHFTPEAFAELSGLSIDEVQSLVAK